VVLWVPRTSSTSRDQAILADHATEASVSSDAVLPKIDRFGQRFQWRRPVQETVRPVLVVAGFVIAQDLPQMETSRRASTITQPSRERTSW
jgi:hypothetical protein